MNPNSQQIAKAGELYVAAELNRRGAHATTFSNNMPKIDIIACNQDQSEFAKVQVITKRHKVWQLNKTFDNLEKDIFWILVDLTPVHPDYYIMKESWLFNNCKNLIQEYLKKHGGKRPTGSKSLHHSILRLPCELRQAHESKPPSHCKALLLQELCNLGKAIRPGKSQVDHLEPE